VSVRAERPEGAQRHVRPVSGGGGDGGGCVSSAAYPNVRDRMLDDHRRVLATHLVDVVDLLCKDACDAADICKVTLFIPFLCTVGYIFRTRRCLLCSIVIQDLVCFLCSEMINVAYRFLFAYYIARACFERLIFARPDEPI